jgi:hypothetical protein
MSTIYLIIIGASAILTPKPHMPIKGSHGIPVKAWAYIKAAAVAAKTGVANAHKKGTAYTFGFLY